MKNGIANTASSIASAAGTVITGAINKVKTFGSNFLSAGKEVFSKVVDGVKNTASSLATAVGTAISGAVKALANVGSQFVSAGGNIV